MKRVIRMGTFETNSSSVHSMVIVTDEEYKKISSYYYDGYELLSEKEYLDKIRKEEKELANLSNEELLCLLKLKTHNELESEYCGMWATFRPYEEFIESDNTTEYDEAEYTTPKGDTIHVIARYGYDG